MYATSAVVVAAHNPQPTMPPHGNSTVTYTTKTVAVLITYCPSPTVIDIGHRKITVDKPTTLTVNDCPCTIVEPCHTCVGPAPIPKLTGPVNLPAPGPGQMPAPGGNPSGEDQKPAPSGNPSGEDQKPAPGGNPAGEGQKPAQGPGGERNVEVAGANARHIAYGFAMVAAAAVGYFALL